VTDVRDVIIIGGGPAGYTAALYAARSNLRPLLIEGFQWGGQLMITSDVENFPGYADGVLGPEMMQDLRRQADRFGTEFLTDDVTRVDLSERPYKVYVGDDEYAARTIIVATGASARQLGLESERALHGRGVTYCATCDAAFYREKEVVVVGGGDSAMEEALFLTKFASKVAVVHRRDEFRASAIMLDRAKDTANIELLTPYVIEEFAAGDDGALGTAVLKNLQGGDGQALDIDGAFIAIGHQPNSQLVDGQVELDDEGYVITQGKSTRTKLEGVFAAGDLVDHTYRQAVTAAGSGCQAALDAEWYLRDRPPDPEAHWASKDEATAPAAPR
jgi:thioredoxin reductase (NADPH)